MPSSYDDLMAAMREKSRLSSLKGRQLAKRQKLAALMEEQEPLLLEAGPTETVINGAGNTSVSVRDELTEEAHVLACNWVFTDLPRADSWLAATVVPSAPTPLLEGRLVAWRDTVVNLLRTPAWAEVGQLREAMRYLDCVTPKTLTVLAVPPVKTLADKNGASTAIRGWHTLLSSQPFVLLELGLGRVGDDAQGILTYAYHHPYRPRGTCHRPSVDPTRPSH